MTLVPELLVQKCQFPLHIQSEHERFKRQDDIFRAPSKFFVVSTTKLYEMGVAFAVFHHLMCAHDPSANRALVVYQDADELREWLHIMNGIFARKRRVFRFFVVDEAKQSVYTNAAVDAPGTHLFVFVRRRALIDMFPVGVDITEDLRPFMSSDEEVVATMRSIHIPVVDSRCISTGDTTLLPDEANTDRFNAYSHFWSSVFFTSKGFADDQNVYDINMLAVTCYRFCIVAVSLGDDIRMSNVRCILNHSDTPINREIQDLLSNDENDDDCIVEDSLGSVVRYFQLQDTPISDMTNLVVFKNKQSVAKTASSSTSAPVEYTVPLDYAPENYANGINMYSGVCELRTIIDFNTHDGLARTTTINDDSRYSMLSVYDERLIETIENLSRYTKKRRAEIYTNENNVHLKCASIIAYTMANLHTPFYLISPYISPVHPLANIANVRCLHITDVNDILAIESEYTLIVFDTFFVNQPKNAEIFRRARCHLLFATFQHTHEEEELQRFVAKKTLRTWKRWMTEEPLYGNDGFSMNTESVFHMVPAHFTNVATSKTHSTIYSFLKDVYADFAKCIQHAHTVDTEELIHLESQELEKAASDLWNEKCCESIIMTMEEQRCFAYANIERNRYERRIGLRPFIPSKNFEMERQALLEEIQTSDYMRRHMKILSKLVPRDDTCRDIKAIREAGDRLAAVNERIQEERRKRDENVLAFLREEARASDYRVRITCNVNYRNYISSITRPPIPNHCAQTFVRDTKGVNVCKICAYKSTRVYNFQRHLQSPGHRRAVEALKSALDSPQRVVATFYCTHCDVQTTTKSEYDRHLATRRHTSMVERGNVIQCQFCDCNPFDTREAYAGHLSSEHGEDVSITCRACDVEINYSELTVHLKTREHRELTEDGPWQRYCTYCDEHFSTTRLAQQHNKTSAHLTKMPTTVNPSNPFASIELQLNRFILAFAVDKHFINASLFTDTHVFNSIVNARPELRQCQDYITLMLIAACISPTRRCIYRTEDGLAGFVVVSFKDQVGILGAFNKQHPDFTALLARFIREFNSAFCYLEYYPAHLELELEAVVRQHNGRIMYTHPYQSQCIPHCSKSYRFMQFALTLEESN